MPHSFFPVISGAALVAGGDTDAKAEPGCLQMYRFSDGQLCFAQYVQNGDRIQLSAGLVAVPNDATMKQYSVQLASVDHGGGPMAGIALATIASQKFGWIAVRGYVGSAYVEQSGTAFNHLFVSGSTAGYLSEAPSMYFYDATTAGSNTSGRLCVAQNKDTTTGLASIQIVGCWGV